MKEIWKDIKNHEGIYQISNLGRIRSVDRFVPTCNNYGCKSKRFIKGKILKTQISYNGYESITIRLLNGKKVRYPIHRLVAKTFIQNPNNYDIINHIDGNKINNKSINLEFCTQSYNVKESYRLGLQNVKTPVMLDNYTPWNKGKKMSYDFVINNCNSKKVNQYDLYGNFIKKWNTIKEAEISLNIHHISMVCRNRRKSAGGYKWEYANK